MIENNISLKEGNNHLNLQKDFLEVNEVQNNNTKIYLKELLKKATRHSYYLKILMFVLMCILYEFELLNKFQSMIVVFIILFNIAFTQNMLNNIIFNNTENKFIIDAKDKKDKKNKDQYYLSE